MGSHSLSRRFLKIFKKQEPETLRDTIEELIEESDESETSIESDERQLLGNVLNLRELTAYDVMIPRADIVAGLASSSPEDLIGVFVKNGLSRIPIYRDNLDNILGSIHIKDILTAIYAKKEIQVKALIRDIMYISPAMRTLDLLLEMRETGVKMAVVVDEYGGVDGLVTFANLIEAIIGDIQDAHNQHMVPIQIQIKPDGTIVTDSRAVIEEINDILHADINLNDAEEDVDTIGGLVTLLAGRVPARGELIKHPNGIEFEVLDADPRRVKKILIRNPS
jgi:magnesium and cobalt transporter